MTKLNVGCGADRWGDIRVDIGRDFWMTPGESSANLLADAQYLPFRDKCFEEVRVHEVLEHIHDWKKALHECSRVANSVSITVPVDSRMPRYYIKWLIPTCGGILTDPTYLLKFRKLTYFRHVSKLPKRARAHLWQFNISVLTSMLKSEGFYNINVEQISFPIFRFLASTKIGKYLSSIQDRFKIAHSWKIIAF